MFDGILNVFLSEEVSTLRGTQSTESWKIYVRVKELREERSSIVEV